MDGVYDNGEQELVTPVSSFVDPVDANYKSCILSVPSDRETFKSELLSKEEKLSLNSIPFDEFFPSDQNWLLFYLWGVVPFHQELITC